MTRTNLARRTPVATDAEVMLRAPCFPKTGRQFGYSASPAAIRSETRPPHRHGQKHVRAMLLLDAQESRPVPSMQCIDSLIAFYQMELPTTDAQLPRWNAFADAVRTRAMRLRRFADADSGHAPPIFLDRLKGHIAWLAVELDTMNAVLSAAQPLYDTMSPEQQALVDGLAAAHASEATGDA